MSDNLTLIGALVATQNITVDDAILLADYCDYAEEAGLKPPTIMSAIDLALDFFAHLPTRTPQRGGRGGARRRMPRLWRSVHDGCGR